MIIHFSTQSSQNDTPEPSSRQSMSGTSGNAPWQRPQSKRRGLSGRPQASDGAPARNESVTGLAGMSASDFAPRLEIESRLKMYLDEPGQQRIVASLVIDSTDAIDARASIEMGGFVKREMSPSIHHNPA
jgi:hypothetical protein